MRHLLLLRHDHANLPHGVVKNHFYRDVTTKEGQGAQRHPDVDDGEGGDDVRLRLDALLRHCCPRPTGEGWFLLTAQYSYYYFSFIATLISFLTV